MNTMRPYQLSLLFLMLTTGDLFATDRVVSPSGLYPTIKDAIVASSDGDRILVTGGTYSDNLLVAKSISILPNQEGVKYTVSGVLEFGGGAGTKILISGGRFTSAIQRSNGAITGRVDLVLVDCYAQFATLDHPSVHCQLYRDTINQYLRFSSGQIIGNTINGAQSSSPALALISGSTLPDENAIIGNAIQAVNGSSFSGYMVDLSPATRFTMENNFLRNQQTNSRLCRIALTVLPPFSLASTIINNTFYHTTNTAFSAVTSEQDYGVVFKNNAVLGDTGPMIDFVLGGDVYPPMNNLAPTSWINTSTGEALIGTPLIDAGDPSPRYLDLDLSINDVGCYGGSNSRANFTTAMGSAVVGHMRAPRVVAQGEPLIISVVGFDR
jgi:hypothetical protein